MLGMTADHCRSWEKRHVPDSPDLILPDHPEQSQTSTISSFHLSEKSSKVGRCSP